MIDMMAIINTLYHRTLHWSRPKAFIWVEHAQDAQKTCPERTVSLALFMPQHMLRTLAAQRTHAYGTVTGPPVCRCAQSGPIMSAHHIVAHALAPSLHTVGRVR